MSSIEQALATFEPISLVGANDIAELQTRIDRKYLVDEATLCELLDAMAPTLRVLEIDGEHSCDYRSTYFDTEDLALYRAAVQGRRRRYKVRSRTYGDTGPCFLEVKAKGHRGANVKSRIGYCRSDHHAITTDGHDFIEEITGGHDFASTLLPVLTTEYNRSTLIDPTSQTRLTFDQRLRCTDEVGGEAILDAIVVETKSEGAPSAADRWLWQHHVRPTKISKFCTGLTAIRPELPANKWHRIIARHWQTQSRIPAAPFLPNLLDSFKEDSPSGRTLAE
jgi:hypothetical protein